MELLVIAVIIGFIVYGLERNKTRKPAAHLVGSTDIRDRDQERFSAELVTRA